MSTTTLEAYAEINPATPAMDRTSREPVLFVPMAGVSEAGRLSAVQTRPLNEVAKGYTYFEDNDVLMAKITPCMENGKAVLLDGVLPPRGFGSTEFHVLRPRPGVHPKFVFFLIWNPRFRGECAKKMTGTGGQKRVPATVLREARVPLYPLAEQRRIADILDKADSIRRKRAEAVAHVDDLLRATFLDMFGDPVTNPKGWPVVPLGDIADTASGVAKGKRYGDQRIVEVPYMRVANVQDGHLALDEVRTISVSEDDAQRYELRSGDVLLTEGGDPDKLGRGCVWRGEIPACIHQNHIFRVRCSPKVVPEFLSTMVGSERGKRYFLRAAKQTTGIATINMGQLRAFPVPLPPLSEQMRFVRAAERVAAFRRSYETAVREANHLFDALVQRAFTGELTSSKASTRPIQTSLFAEGA